MVCPRTPRPEAGTVLISLKDFVKKETVVFPANFAFGQGRWFLVIHNDGRSLHYTIALRLSLSSVPVGLPLRASLSAFSVLVMHHVDTTLLHTLGGFSPPRLSNTCTHIKSGGHTSCLCPPLSPPSELVQGVAMSTSADTPFRSFVSEPSLLEQASGGSESI